MAKAKKKEAGKVGDGTAKEVLDPLRPGMPAKDSVRKVVDLVSPKKVHYKILKTTETDVYDPVPKAKKR